MKKALLIPLVTVLGLGLGGGAGWGAIQLLGPAPGATADHAAEPERKVETVFLPTGPLTAPIVTTDGDLSGYAVFELQLEVETEGAEHLGGQMPLVLNAINLRTFRTPMAAGKDKILPDLDVMSHVAMEAAAEALGKGKVKRAVVTSAKPL